MNAMMNNGKTRGTTEVTIENKAGTYTRMSANKLLAAPYQREIRRYKVENIKRNYDPLKAKPIVVSRRNGKYYIIDGDHTITAQRELFGETCMVDVRIIDGLTYEQESEYYDTQYDNCTKLSSIEHMKSRVEYESKAKDMVQLCADKGFVLATCMGKSKNKINAVSTFEKVYDMLGNNDTANMLALIKEIWDGDKEALSSQFLEGIGKFYSIYKGKMNTKRFVKVFSDVPAIDITSAVNKQASLGMTKADRMVLKFREMYNYRYKNKLPEPNFV